MWIIEFHEEEEMPTESSAPSVKAGDRLVVHAHHQGTPPLDAEILEVLGQNGPYRVRWESDGHESILYPGSDASIEHFPAHKPA